jgi:hypothetical protein
MEKQEVVSHQYRAVLGLMILCAVGGMAFLAGIVWATGAQADEPTREAGSAPVSGSAKEPRVVYPKKTELDFEGLRIEGEIRNPGEFYFQRRTEEKFDSLVKRRKNFHREMLRDAVLSK